MVIRKTYISHNKALLLYTFFIKKAIVFTTFSYFSMINSCKKTEKVIRYTYIKYVDRVTR